MTRRGYANHEGGFPDFVRALEGAPIAPPTSVYLARNDVTVGFYESPERLDMAPHSHCAQWGVVLEGLVTFEIDGQQYRFDPGDTYFIPDSVVHRAILEPGTRGIDVFADPERY